MAPPFLAPESRPRAGDQVISTSLFELQSSREDVLIIRLKAVRFRRCADRWRHPRCPRAGAQEKVPISRIHPNRMYVVNRRETRIVAEEDAIPLRVRELGRRRHRGGRRTIQRDHERCSACIRWNREG